MTNDRLDLDDPTLWNMIHHGLASLVESVAIDLVAEVRALREQVVTLKGAMRDHADCRVCRALLASHGGDDD